MKKMKTMASIFVFAALLLTGCGKCENEQVGSSSTEEVTQATIEQSGNAEHLKIQIYSVGDGSSTASVQPDFELWKQDHWEESGVAAEYEIRIQNQSICGAYQYSRIQLYTGETLRRYQGSNEAGQNVIFYVDDQGRVVNFIISRSSNDGEEPCMSEEECKRIAVDWIREQMDFDEEAYRIEVYDFNYAYGFSWQKYVGDMETIDCVYVVVSKQGEIYSYYNSLFGQINEEEVPEFDRAEIEAEIKAVVKEKFADAEGKAFSYEIARYMLTKTAGRYLLICEVSIDVVVDSDVGEICPELIGMVVWLE